MSSFADISQTTRMGFEPTTSAVTGRRSNQLSHRAISINPYTFKTKYRKSFSSAWLSPRPISTHQLNTLLCLHLKPIYLVVFKGSSLTGISHLEGGFTLRCLQRLSLPDLATLPWDWFPTGPPAVRPSRSSRTKDSSSQISCACAG